MLGGVWNFSSEFSFCLCIKTSVLFQTCMDKPGPKLTGREQNCLSNCVQRFIDANILVTKNLEKKADQILKQHDGMSSME